MSNKSEHINDFVKDSTQKAVWIVVMIEDIKAA